MTEIARQSIPEYQKAKIAMAMLVPTTINT